MNVSSVNSVNFRGKTGETNIGIKYEKSNEGRKYYPLIVLAGTGVQCALMPKENIALFKKIPAFQNKSTATLAILGTIGFVGALAYGCGYILDAIINKRRRKDANKLAVTSELNQETNKGKKVCTAIGVGAAALGLITKNPMLGNARPNKIISAIAVAAGWLGIGAIYDHGVNKFRNKLKESQQN